MLHRLSDILFICLDLSCHNLKKMLVWYSWSSWWFVWSSSWFWVHVDGEEVHDFRGWGWMRKWMRFEEDLPLVHVACVWFNYLACISSTWRRCPSGPLMLPIPVVLRLWVGLLCVWLYSACALVWFVACLPALVSGALCHWCFWTWCLCRISLMRCMAKWMLSSSRFTPMKPEVYLPLISSKLMPCAGPRCCNIVLWLPMIWPFFGYGILLYSNTKAICVK